MPAKPIEDANNERTETTFEIAPLADPNDSWDLGELNVSGGSFSI